MSDISINKNNYLKENFFGEKSVVISKSGYGKSYTTRVIIEEGVKKGNTFIVIDPQDAYLNLPKFSYIDAKDVKSAKGLGYLLAKTNKNTIIQTKRLTIDEQNKFLFEFLTSYRVSLKKGIQTIVIDEAHKFAPEQEKTLAKDIVRAMFQENRSDGLGCIAITQRIARLDKTIISQADNIFIGRVTSHVDKQTIKQYLENPDDIEKICKLEKGNFYLSGLDLESPEIVKIRKSNSEHSGNSPTNLLTEQTDIYYSNVKSYVKKTGDGKMSIVGETQDIVQNIVPSVATFKDLALMGAKMSLGLAVSGVVSNFVASKFASPIPYVSSRTLASAGSTILMYAGYKMIPASASGVKDVVKYATAGSAVYTAGSLVYDVIALTKVQVPAMVNTLITSASGVTPLVAQNQAQGVDLNTNFA